MRNPAKKSAFSGLAVLVIGLSFIQQQIGETDFSANPATSGKEVAEVVETDSVEESETVEQAINQVAKDEVARSGVRLETAEEANQLQQVEQSDKDRKKELEVKEVGKRTVNKEISVGSEGNVDQTDVSKETSRTFTATAYCLKGKTASGMMVRRGVIAADPKVLPIGSLVKLTAGSYSGTYIVADTGSKVKGRKIDVWVPKCSEAIRFGRRTVKLTVIQKRK